MQLGQAQMQAIVMLLSVPPGLHHSHKYLSLGRLCPGLELATSGMGSGCASKEAKIHGF